MATTFKILDEQGIYSFTLVNDEGITLLIGAEYDTAEEAEAAIQEVRVGSLMSQQIAAGKTHDGQSFFVIKNAHGVIIAKSGLYDNQMQFDADLHTVKDMACVAEIAIAA